MILGLNLRRFPRRGDRPLPVRQAGRSPVRLIPNGSIKMYAGGATVSCPSAYSVGRFVRRVGRPW
ncbi:MAG: hypothetical protein FWG68_12265 [Defluviitaleaceae bacterium]|nr:hypothetical protein [Defluviitaleaceae bacterium]